MLRNESAIKTSEKLLQFIGNGVSVLKNRYENDHGIIALNKPEGISSHPNNNSHSEISKSLIKLKYDLKKEMYYENETGVKYYLLNRLDSATSGVILLTNSEVMASQMKTLFKEKGIHKTYIAKVFGNFLTSKYAEWKDPMEITKLNNKYLRVHSPSLGLSRNSKVATCKARLLVNKEIKSRDTMTSLIELFPMTGFTHQLRFQCSLHGFPVVNDNQYGNFELNRIFQRVSKDNLSKLNLPSLNNARLFLHSHKVSFQYYLNNRSYNFEAESPIPREFIL